VDSVLQQMLGGFRLSLDHYAGTLAPDNAKLLKARSLMTSLTEKAEQGADLAAVSMDPDFAALGMLLGELAAEPPAPAGAVPAAPGGAQPASTSGIPAASLAAAGYHMAWSALPPDAQAKQRPYYDRIFAIEGAAPDAAHFNTLLEEDGVLLEMARDPLVDTARETLAQAEALHAPTILHQQRLAMETYTRCGSRAELEYRGTLMAETANVEHEWDSLYIEVMGLLPACAQAIEAFGPNDESVAKLKASYRFMADFWGITWEDVFEDPRYLLFWREVFWPRVPEAKRQMYGIRTPEGWRDLLKGTFFDPFVKDEPQVASDPAKARVTFWRSEHPTREVLDLLENPPRPDVPED
jgi:hypothetical protein